ncbi:MAG: ribonuclease HI family protein [Candidatus Levyibacteriota bacterium]
MNLFKVYTDGGSRGNPGPSGIGIYIIDSAGKKIFSHGEKIGMATNNVAEYKAVIKALAWILENKKLIGEAEINFFLDSKLICSQITGIFKVKDANLRNLLFEVREKEAGINSKIKYFYIPREKNVDADKLVNLALDNKI